MQELREFISAYIWMFGGSKKHASCIYKREKSEGNEGYIKGIIECWKNNCICGFYQD